MTELLEPLPQTRQIYFRRMAQYAVSFYCDKHLALIEAIKLLLNDPNISHKPLHDKYGKEKTSVILQRLNITHNILHRIKSYYDSLKPTTINEQDITSKTFIAFTKNLQAIPLIDTFIHRIHYTIINATTLRDMSIPAEAFAEEARKYKSFEIEEEEIKLRQKEQNEELEDYE